jgi:CRISPR/Cas system-associated protein Cas10 (large subunit of type III CRISPR-Cas system)
MKLLDRWSVQIITITIEYEEEIESYISTPKHEHETTKDKGKKKHLKNAKMQPLRGGIEKREKHHDAYLSQFI